MKILLLGSGGREHAYAWKIAQSPKCSQLFIAPGNPGTAEHGTNLNIDILDFNTIEKVCLENQIEFLVVGPEQPLVAGIYDYFKKSDKLNHIPIFGPSLNGAMLEGSKGYAKEFMFRHNIPTANYKEFDGTQVEEGIAYLKTQSPPIVLKADGLAAGKGVVISPSIEEAINEFKDMLGGKFGSAGAKVVIEEFMTGLEYSVFVLTDGISYKILPVAKDYKRIGEGDTGLNTGGMGAISRPPFVTEALMKITEETSIIPTIEGLIKEGIAYNGIVYIGLMNTPEAGPRVVEYNCRMGDPETQAVFPRIKGDFLELLLAASNGCLENVNVELDDRAAATVILASGGYPEAYEKGKVISGIDDCNDSLVFHAGTKKSEDGSLVTNGGRVLAVTSLHENWEEALAISNRNANKIKFEGKYSRKDIGFDLK